MLVDVIRSFYICYDLQVVGATLDLDDDAALDLINAGKIVPHVDDGGQ